MQEFITHLSCCSSSLTLAARARSQPSNGPRSPGRHQACLAHWVAFSLPCRVGRYRRISSCTVAARPSIAYRLKGTCTFPLYRSRQRQVNVCLKLSDSDISRAMVSISGRNAWSRVQSSQVDITGWQPRAHISVWYELPSESQRVAIVLRRAMAQDSA